LEVLDVLGPKGFEREQTYNRRDYANLSVGWRNGKVGKIVKAGDVTFLTASKNGHKSMIFMALNHDADGR